MKHVWFISGLGIDERAFSNLDLSGIDAHLVHWVTPAPSDTIADYARRLLPQIQEENPIIVGYSLGGMLAIELSKIIPVKYIILLASAKTRAELPPYYRMATKLPLHKWIPISWIKNNGRLHYWLLNLKGGDKQLLLEPMIKNADPKFLRWGMDAVVHWQNKEYPSNLTHIHGTADRILPFRYVHADIAIPGAGHGFPVHYPQKTMRYIREILNKIED